MIKQLPFRVPLFISGFPLHCLFNLKWEVNDKSGDGVFNHLGQVFHTNLFKLRNHFDYLKGTIQSGPWSQIESETQ